MIAVFFDLDGEKYCGGGRFLNIRTNEAEMPDLSEHTFYLSNPEAIRVSRCEFLRIFPREIAEQDRSKR